MIQARYCVRCDICSNVMSVTGQFPTPMYSIALYPDVTAAVNGGNSKHWLVWQEVEDEGTDLWHVLCPNDQ